MNKGNSALWEISKKGSVQKSYLPGTYHGGTTNSISYSYVDTLPRFKNILDEVDAIGIECVFADTIFLKMVADNINNCFFKRSPSDAFLPDNSRKLESLSKSTGIYTQTCNKAKHL